MRTLRPTIEITSVVWKNDHETSDDEKVVRGSPGDFHSNAFFPIYDARTGLSLDSKHVRTGSPTEHDSLSRDLQYPRRHTSVKDLTEIDMELSLYASRFATQLLVWILENWHIWEHTDIIQTDDDHFRFRISSREWVLRDTDFKWVFHDNFHDQDVVSDDAPIHSQLS